MRIASFNAQRFGVTKVSDPDVLSTLIKIVSRYDIIVILEVVDVSGTSIKLFLTELNRVNSSHHYALQLSTRLGRTRYKEQFMFLYRDDIVDLIDSYQYEGNQKNDVDTFAREPYVLYFKPHDTVLKDLVLIPVHATPEDSEKELDELYDVFLMVRDKWKTDNVMILGYFRADRGSVTDKEMKKIRIRSDTNFHWLIADDALRVSDHYPVEVELISASPFWVARRGYATTKQTSISKPATGSLQEEVMSLRRETLLLQREKLQLQISYLKKKLASVEWTK